MSGQKVKAQMSFSVPSLFKSLSLLMIPFAFLISPLSSGPARSACVDERELLETGRASALFPTPASPGEFKIVSYNIRWRCCEELRQLIEMLRSDAEIGRASIIGLQEVDRNKKRTRHTNTVREMAEALGMYYAWAAPPPPPASQEQEEETGVAILSHYPLTEVRRIVLPQPGPGGRRRVALGATVKLGDASLRVYSIHAETRIAVDQRLKQFQAMLDDLKHHAKTESAIVLGDFNTWQGTAPRDTTRLFESAGFTTPFPADEPTHQWKQFILTVKLKLDWVWLRGLSATGYGIDREINISDHWPLWANVRLDPQRTATK